MIDGHEKFRMPDDNKKHDWFAEVNWNEKDDKTNECKVLKITSPDGKVSYIKKEHFFAVVFAIGNAAEQREMVPQTVTKMKHYETIVGVKATKDIKKGEEVRFPIKLTIPAGHYETMGTGEIENKIIGSGTSLPKNLDQPKK